MTRIMCERCNNLNALFFLQRGEFVCNLCWNGVEDVMFSWRFEPEKFEKEGR